jgi:hypothetical protein
MDRRADRLVLSKRVKAEHDVVEPAATVGRMHLLDDAAIAEEPYLHAMIVGHGVDVDGLPVGGGSERRTLYRRCARRACEQRARDTGRQKSNHACVCAPSMPLKRAIIAARFPKVNARKMTRRADRGVA